MKVNGMKEAANSGGLYNRRAEGLLAHGRSSRPRQRTRSHGSHFGHIAHGGNLDVAKVLNNIPIIHLRGWLGYLPWQGRDEYFSEAKRVLQEAKRVHLSGFGFGAKNVERIGLSSLTPETYSGTAVGYTQREAGYYR